MPKSIYARLAAATRGLLLPSEQDAPLEPFVLPFMVFAPSLLSIDGVEVPKTQMSVEDFFAPYCTSSSQDYEDVMAARRFRLLQSTIERCLHDTMVWTAQHNGITHIICIGRTNEQWAGIYTTRTET